jgi:hypothetical protein
MPFLEGIVTKRVFGVLAGLLFASSLLLAQNPFEDAIKQLSSDNVKGYLQPFINGVGANLNSGLYNTAEIGESGVHFRLTIVAMGTMIGDAEKTYNATPPSPFSQTPVPTATVYGGQGTVVPGPLNSGIQYQFQNGQVKTSIIPLAAPQLTIGTFFGTQAILRYVPIPSVHDFPKVTLFGIGAQHSLNRYLSGLPVDLSAGLFYQSLTVGDIIDVKTFNLGAQASKSWALFTLYGGAQYETSSMNLTYTYTGSSERPTISVDFTGENKFRATAGLGINLVILHLNADISVGKVTVASAGIGFGN